MYVRLNYIRFFDFIPIFKVFPNIQRFCPEAACAIRSANVSRKDQLAYFSHGAHCVIGKDVPPTQR